MLATECKSCSLKEIFEIVQICTVTLSIIIGGVWALFKYVIHRTIETALDINVEVKSSLFNIDNYVVSFNTILKNIGQREIIAKAKKDLQNPEYIYSDEKDAIKYSCELQIKKIRSNLQLNGPLSWYLEANFEEDAISINVLEEYATTKNGDVDFFMEPNEVYKLFQSVILTKGHYLGKVIFIGNRNNKEYWSQMFYFEVDHSNENENRKTS